MQFTQRGQSTPYLISIFAAGLLFFLTAGRLPMLPSVFDWDILSWPLGSLNQTYTGIGAPATDFTYTFTGDTNRLEDWHSPETNRTVTGGLVPAEDTLLVAVDYETVTEHVILTIDLSIESADVSFLLMDIDSPNEGNGIDRVEISGFDSQDNFVSPVLTVTDPSCVHVLGNLATGVCFVNNNTDNGNVMVSFNSGVKKIVLRFLEAALSGNPLGHGVGLHDINFDPVGPPPTPTPTLTATPTLTVTPGPSPTPGPTATPPTSTPPPPPGLDHFLPLIMKWPF